MSIKYTNKTGSGDGRVVKLLACGAKGPGFDSRSRRLKFRDWLSPASGSDVAEIKRPNPQYNQPTNQKTETCSHY